MTEMSYTDAFGKKTILEVIEGGHKNYVSIAIRKERVVVWEALPLEVAENFGLLLASAANNKKIKGGDSDR